MIGLSVHLSNLLSKISLAYRHWAVTSVAFFSGVGRELSSGFGAGKSTGSTEKVIGRT